MFSFQVQKYSTRSSEKMTLASNNESKNGKDLLQQNHEEGIPESIPCRLSDLCMQSTEIGEITEMPNFEMLNTSAVLHYCEHKILRPYLRLLGVMGLKPISNDDSQRCTRYCIFANLHTCQVAIFMCVGYILQYMACFRRDRGFCYKTTTLKFQLTSSINEESSKEITCFGNVIFSYLIPSILHLVAYIYTVYLFRIKENEQLQNLMERAFLLSSSNSVNRGNQRKLVRILWFFIALSLVWIIMALITVNVLIAQESIVFQWLEHSQVEITLKVLLIICTLWHDMVQGTIITSYCLQGQLLLAHLYFLREKLLHHTLPPIDWMKEISEFRKLLKYFNNDLGPAVCIYTVVNLSWAAAGTIWLLRYDNSDMQTNPVTWIETINVILWILISIVPFIQAARLTTACSMIQSMGHEVRIRPFVYQTTPGEDLDSILLYTSSLKMYAKLFRIPITGRYLCLLLSIGSILILTLGQCQFF